MYRPSPVLPIISIITAVMLIVQTVQLGKAQADLATSKQRYVQVVCDIAHYEVSGASEEACGQAQDETGYEYKCEAIVVPLKQKCEAV